MFKKSIDGIEFREIPLHLIDVESESNPRIGVNEVQQELKNSIKSSHARNVVLEVSQIPGSDRYCLFRGGKSRLKVLAELGEEWEFGTENPFEKVKCMVFPWDELNQGVLTATENLVRGELCYAEQARAVTILKERYRCLSDEDRDVSFVEWVVQMGISINTTRQTINQYELTDTYITAYMPKLMIEGRAKTPVVRYLLNTRSKVKTLLSDRLYKERGVVDREVLSRSYSIEIKEIVSTSLDQIMIRVFAECDALTLDKKNMNRVIVGCIEDVTGVIDKAERNLFVPEDNPLVEKFAGKYKLDDVDKIGDDRIRNAALLLMDTMPGESKLTANKRTRVMKKLEVHDNVSGFWQLVSQLDSGGKNMLAQMIKES